jgi:hypothetical protein
MRPRSTDGELGWRWVFLVLLALLALAALILSVFAYLKALNNNVQQLCGVLCQGPCIDGRDGVNGTDGLSGALDFADFYALMPADNPSPIALGGDVAFPGVGPAKTGTGIIAASSTTFTLTATGIYQVSFFVSITEVGQLVLTLNGSPLLQTVTGRDTGTNYITATVFITVGTPSSLLTVQNPSGNAGALTITPSAGGVDDVSAHLSIVRLS